MHVVILQQGPLLISLINCITLYTVTGLSAQINTLSRAHVSNKMSEGFIKEFKAIYKREGKNNLSVQTPYLCKLAELYEQRAGDEPTQNWTSALKAHTLYNSCSGRNSDLEVALQYQLRAFGIHNLYNKARGLPEVSSAQLLLLWTAHKLQLRKIRKKYRREVAPLNMLIETYQTAPEHLCSDQNQRIETEFCNHMEAISRQCTADMVCFAQGIIEDAIQLLQAEPPCGVAAVALSSLARGEATPYSDLEFFFLVERKDPTTITYFESLAMTIYYLVGNLQETTLKYMSIRELNGWFEDCSKNGFRIDGLQDKAGNIPTGNGTTNPKNKWICTLQELAERYAAVYTGQVPSIDKDSKIVGDLADMMAFLKLMYSWGECGHRIFKKLCDFIDIRPDNKYRDLISENTFREDCKNYFWDPLKSHAKNGQMMNVKTDFYRLPSLTILCIKMMYRSKGTSPYEILDSSNKQESKSIKVMLSIALFARLSAYLHYDSQQELICIYQGSPLNVEGAQGCWCMSWAALVAYSVNFYIFKDQLKDRNNISGTEIKYKAVVHAAMALSDGHRVATYAKHVSYECLTLPYSMTSHHVILIAHSFLTWHMHTKCIYLLERLHQNIGVQSASNRSAIYALLFAANLYLDRHKESVKWKKELMGSGIEQLTLEENSYLISALFVLKAGNITTGFDVSIIGDSTHGHKSPEICLDNQGMLSFLKDDYKMAIEYYQQREEYLNKSYGSDVCFSLKAGVLTEQAICYSRLAQHSKSLRLYKEALVIRMRLYGTQLHYNYGGLYESISAQSFKCKEYKEAANAALCALKYYTKYRTEKRVVYIYKLLVKIYYSLGDQVTGNAYQTLAKNFVCSDVVSLEGNLLC